MSAFLIRWAAIAWLAWDQWMAERLGERWRTTVQELLFYRNFYIGAHAVSIQWIHTLCPQCHARQEPDLAHTREVFVREFRRRVSDMCCDCGTTTRSGIQYMARPDDFRCGGSHKMSD